MAERVSDERVFNERLSDEGVFNERLSDFVREVFGDMFEKELLINESIMAEDFVGHYATINRFVHMFYVTFDAIHLGDMRDFFQLAELDRLNALRLLVFHCYQIVPRCPNIIIGLLYVFSFTFTLLKFCEIRGILDLRLHFQECLIEIFNKKIKASFIDAGSWSNLFKFCSSENENNLLEMLTFFEVCYSRRYFLETDVYTGVAYLRFGVHSAHTLLVVKLWSIHLFEKSLLQIFGYKIHQFTDYRDTVYNAFRRIKSALRFSEPFSNLQWFPLDVMVNRMWDVEVYDAFNNRER